jgi:hypothetical protein
MNMHRDAREFEDLRSSEPIKPKLLSRILRFLGNILSSPGGAQGGWEGGARGL